MLNDVIESLAHDSIVTVLIVSMMLDTVLGILSAIKERKFNSTIGINGVIRKVAMFVCVSFLMCIDCIIHIDLLFMVPSEYITVLGFEELGLCEFFSLIFILCESVSILKNMIRCNLPIPPKIKKFVEGLLDNMTSELNEKR